VFGLVSEDLVQDAKGAVDMSLGRVDLGEGDRRDRGRHGTLFEPNLAPDERRRIRKVQPLLDDARHEIACDAEEASHTPPFANVFNRNAKDLVDELDPSHDLGASDAGLATAQDELFTGEGLETRAIDRHEGHGTRTPLPPPARALQR
jgi:hypothetical protein